MILDNAFNLLFKNIFINIRTNKLASYIQITKLTPALRCQFVLGRNHLL